MLTSKPARHDRSFTVKAQEGLEAQDGCRTVFRADPVLILKQAWIDDVKLGTERLNSQPMTPQSIAHYRQTLVLEATCACYLVRICAYDPLSADKSLPMTPKRIKWCDRSRGWKQLLLHDVIVGIGRKEMRVDD